MRQGNGCAGGGAGEEACPAQGAEEKSGAHEKPTKQQDKRKEKHNGEEMKLGIVAEAGRVPAVKGFKEWDEQRHGKQDEGSKLEQPPHESMLAQREKRGGIEARF